MWGNTMNRDEYLHAKKNNSLERYRGDEISRRIALRYPMSAQIAIVADRDDKPYEFQEFQAFRKQVKAEVDAEIMLMEYNY